MDRDGIKRVGEWVRAAREARDMSQLELATAARVAVSTLQQIEKPPDRPRGPNGGTLMRIELALGVPDGTLARVAANDLNGEDGEREEIEAVVRRLSREVGAMRDELTRLGHPPTE